MSTPSADVIVLGLGGMGSATLYQLASRGYHVLGLDRFLPRHTFGSSHGQTRIIREAYFEAPEYVPLVRRAYELWRQAEDSSGNDLLRVTGALTVGRPDSEIVQGTVLSGEKYGVACESLDPSEIQHRYPGFALDDEMIGVYEPNGGILNPERCIDTFLHLAERHGAKIHRPVQALSWSATNSSVTVQTTDGPMTAERLVVTAGPWVGEMVPDLNLPLERHRVYVTHFESEERDLFHADRTPVSIWDTPDGSYYILPYLPGQGVKIGCHNTRDVVNPETMDRTVSPQEIASYKAVLDRWLPGSTGPVIDALTCIYTMTPDHHFILDQHPEWSNIAYATGFSGHGFKFASVIGEIMADLAIDGRTMNPIEFLSRDRF